MGYEFPVACPLLLNAIKWAARKSRWFLDRCLLFVPVWVNWTLQRLQFSTFPLAFNTVFEYSEVKLINKSFYR